MELPKEKVVCGAKRRNGEPCKNSPLTGKTRCKFHGGASNKPAEKGNQRAVSHGIYSSFMSDDDKTIWDGIELGKVDDELRLCRFRLQRALKAEALANDAIELDSYSEQDATLAAIPIKNGAELVATMYFKRREFAPIINGLLARIESLEKTRAELMKNDTGANKNDPVTRIEIEVVSGNVKTNNDGAAS